ncbi:MAG: hypothetical protein BMS9Abin29_2411 [Gemmatimonadota bacterium]|nr:MAG: hypothetical protein BMS9Abin29_2411 [Gemmatimonadota bacterium]
MNWEAVGAISELVGATGVIASLIYVGVQVRQNTRSMRAATYDSLVRSNGDWLAPIIQDAELAASFEVAVASWAKVEEAQRPRVMYLLTQLFRHWENAFFQQEQGALAPSLWLTWQGIILSYFHQPGIQEWWQLRRTAYSNEFREFLEMSSPPPSGLRTTRQIDGQDTVGEQD